MPYSPTVKTIVENISAAPSCHAGLPKGHDLSANLDYEQQQEAMDFIEVTRLFKVDEFTEYLNEIELYYSVENIILPHPDDLYYESFGYRRAA